jgi:hypothetical protein
MFNTKRLIKLLKKKNNATLKESMAYSADTPVKGFQYLISIRDTVDLEAYAMYVRMLTQADTDGVPLEVLLEAYRGLAQNDLMSIGEIQKLDMLPEQLVIYRGTDPSESVPRLSWSLSKETAEIYRRGRMFRARISKKDILAYYCENCDEEEIIAHVTGDYEVI